MLKKQNHMSFSQFRNSPFLLILLIFSLMISCQNKQQSNDIVENSNDEIIQKSIVVGAKQIGKYLPLLKGKKVGIVANQTSVIFKDEEEKKYIHIVDSLLSLDANIVKAFAPEHGFRGKVDGGEHISDGVDTETGLPIVSIYGNNIKPSEKHLEEIDIMLFDIQDVGVRFYTYISTLHYVMEACAEANIPLLILDRPNPNAHYIDGPVLEIEYKSFVGIHSVPIVHGMTIGEYAKMINGEKWLDNGIQCDITVLPVENYTHAKSYSLPVKPSPNLPNDVSINLYASLGLFEGTNVSIGRGTDKQIQIAGIPELDLERFNYKFTPKSNAAKTNPKHEGVECYGYDLSSTKKLNGINLEWLIDFYNANKEYNSAAPFFNEIFIKLAGTKNLQKQIEQGLSADEIRATWQDGLDDYRAIRNKYLLYE